MQDFTSKTCKCRLFFVSLQSKHKLITMPSPEVQAMIPKIQAYLATQPVERAYLFGSCARGDERPDSDVDLLVSLDYSRPIGLKYFGMMCDLEDRLGRKVDLVSEDGLMSFARPYVDNDKILLYERVH